MFDPNSASVPGSGIFGLPYQYEESSLIYLPVPWEATTSYRTGTAKGPSAIFEASHQVDLFHALVNKPYEAGLFFQKESKLIRELNKKSRLKAEKIIAVGGKTTSKSLKKDLDDVNSASKSVNEFVFEETKKILKSKKIPAIVGGDHSVPFGAIRAMAESTKFGILHFDAHSDTRNAFEGFQHSHASIMHNVLTQIPKVEKLVQVGIRDFCEEEVLFCASQKRRVKIFYDQYLAQQKFEGISWSKTVSEIISELPENVWISFDIDGLDPKYCPNTGTPVPGGMEFNEVVYLFQQLVLSKRKIVGFDLNEVAPSKSDEWDANVGARLLYQLTAWTLASQGKCKLN